jgi:transposase
MLTGLIVWCLRVCRRERGMSIKPGPWPEPAEEITRAVRAIYARGRKVPLPVRVRDELGEVFADAEFAGAFGVRGRPGWSPGRLALITVLQMAENLTDRQAAEQVRMRIDWKYALGLGLAEDGIDPSVLSEFRARVVAHGLEEKALELLLAALRGKGLLAAGGKQRTDSTHVIAAVRDLNRLELAGESVRACLEALAVAAPGWLASAVDVAGLAERYGSRVDSWRLPTAKAKRDELARVYGQDAVTVVRAVYAPDAPTWLREVPAVGVMRTVLLQQYVVSIDRQGREVVKWREAAVDGLPPGRLRLSSPYDLDARWAAHIKGAKGQELVWNGFKVHLTETCDAAEPAAAGPAAAGPAAAGPAAAGPAAAGRVGRPNLIVNVATTDATVPDAKLTPAIHARLATRRLLPGQHYVDSGYPSAELLVQASRTYGIALVSPLLGNPSAQAKAGAGYDRASFEFDYDRAQARCPQGQTSTWWHPTRQRGREVIVVKFAARTCQPCPARDQCTRSTSAKFGRQFTIPAAREVHHAQQAARAAQAATDWPARYAIRAGVEGTIHQAIAVCGMRRARYRGLGKTHLQHVFTAVALNLIRLDAWWNDHPLDRKRTSHLTRLHLAQAA